MWAPGRFLAQHKAAPGRAPVACLGGHGRAHCWTLRTPSTAWTTRPEDAARRPLESRNHGWDGRLPPFLKRGPTEGTCAPPVTERAAYLAGKKWPAQAHTPLEVTRLSPSTPNHRPRPGHDRACKRSRVRIWLAGGPFCMGWSVRWPAPHTRWASQVRPLAWAARDLSLARARAGRPLEACARLPTRSPPRAAHRSLRRGARAAYISHRVCVLSVYRDGWIGSSLSWLDGTGGPCRPTPPSLRCQRDAGAYAHISGWMGGCLRIPRMDAAGGHAGIRRGRRPCACRCKCPRRRRAALRCQTRARAHRPTGHLWHLPCPSGCLSTRCRSLARAGQLVTPGACECVARPSVCPWRAPACRRPACPRGSHQLVTPAAPPRGAPAAPTRPANWPPRAACAPPPPPPPPPRPPLPSPRPPFDRPRARDSLLASRARAYRAPSPLNDSPQPGPSRAPPAPFSSHPTDLARPIIVRQTFQGRTSFRGRPTCAGRPRAAVGHVPQPTGHCPSSPGGGGGGSPRPSRPANWRESMEVEIPRGPAVTGAPRLRRKVSGPPSKRPALPGPLMGGVCQQI
ncbi:hypothetical protein V6Z77_010208 [Aspergillus fumigatus]